MKKTVEPARGVTVFARQVEAAIALPLPNFLRELTNILQDGEPILDGLNDIQRQGSTESYLRNILYADSQGRFTVMALTWREGQFTPIHGHWTWCGYTVLRGEMEEENFEWNPVTRLAELKQRVARPLKDTVVSKAGLDDIHRLGNYCVKTAISLHVYGVDAQSVTTRVNRVVDGQLDLSHGII